jgi:hypothetical protein
MGKSPGRCPYFDAVVRFPWSYHLESYADGIIAAGRVSHTGQVKKGIPWSSRLRVGHVVHNPTL